MKNKEIVRTNKVLILKEPGEEELKRFKREVIEGLTVVELKKEIEKLKQVIDHLNIRNKLYVEKLNHMDKLSKEEWIAYNKELKQMKINSIIGDLEVKIEELRLQLKQANNRENKLIEQNLQYKVKLKEI